jgi:hypothetical protein
MPGRGPLMWRMSNCCGGDDITQVDIQGDGTTIGLAGVRQAFQELYAAGVAPDEKAGEQLLAMIKRRNHVPQSAESLYKAALLREYAAFCQIHSA